MDEISIKARCVLARMQVNLDRGLGIRLSNDDLRLLSIGFLGEVMAGAKADMTQPAGKVPASSGQGGR